MRQAVRQHRIALILLVGVATTCLAGPLTISNRGVDADGRYIATVDDYGAVDGWSSQGDAFNPAGPTGASYMTFTAGTFVFVSNTHRELLSSAAVWQDTMGYSGDASLTRTIISPNAASDTNGDGFSDTLTSVFDVTGSGVNLRFALTQSVLDGSPATTNPGTNTAVHSLNYTITNNEATPLTFKLSRQTDADMFLVGTNTNDYIAVGSAAGLKWVGQNEGGDPILGYALSSPGPHSYTGILDGLLPQPDPAYPGGATNNFTWDNYGLPAGWVDFAGGLGPSVEGTAGPPAADSGSFLEWVLSLQPGASATVAMDYVYGGVPVAQETVIPEPCSLALLAAGLGGMLLRRRRRA